MIEYTLTKIFLTNWVKYCVKSVEWQNLTNWWLIGNNTKKDFTERSIYSM